MKIDNKVPVHLYHCKWAGHPAWALDLLNAYRTAIAGGGSVLDLSPVYLDVQEAIQRAQGVQSRKKKQIQDDREYIKSLGVY